MTTEEMVKWKELFLEIFGVCDAEDKDALALILRANVVKLAVAKKLAITMGDNGLEVKMPHWDSPVCIDSRDIP
jgi:hypothetical protein